ncbi:hypothetical protein PG994_000091 [Apiospora phragmitis]|uniref:HTH lacI-type domain-containing protein n=1 Tax=Apiospora phragmitis TaxID=2905665 RepID=A0ABR1X5B6_9PEZI
MWSFALLARIPTTRALCSSYGHHKSPNVQQLAACAKVSAVTIVSKYRALLSSESRGAAAR